MSPQQLIAAHARLVQEWETHESSRIRAGLRDTPYMHPDALVDGIPAWRWHLWAQRDVPLPDSEQQLELPLQERSAA